MAHANDHADADSYLQTSGGLLMVYGLGAIVGPVVGGWAMSATCASGMFLTRL